MRKTLRKVTAPLVAVATALSFTVSASAVLAATCDEISQSSTSQVEIISANLISAGADVTIPGRGGDKIVNDLPEFCRVSANLHPVEGSNILIELWIPATASWNKRYLGVGGGAFAGSVGLGSMTDPLKRGYAVSSTDTGHEGGSGAFGLNEVQAEDFIHRSIHAMAEASKSLITSFHGKEAEYSLFSGCSTGGRQAFTEVQRYPDDFDGVIAGDAAAYVSHLQGTQVWMGLLQKKYGGTLSNDDVTTINQAALNKCDMNDGLADGIISDPNSCSFNPNSLVGHGLNQAQANIANAMYDGPKTSYGASLYPGLPHGSEKLWPILLGKPLGLAQEMYRYFVYGDENWDESTFDFAKDAAYADATRPGLSSWNADISAFVDKGGKFLIYHGWNDWIVSPFATVDYYEQVNKTVGASAADAVRLFMIPGMGHCSGGGIDTFDMLAELDNWVTSGKAPSSVAGSQMANGEAIRTRPLCAYPAKATYNGTGSINDAANFTCE